MTEGNNRSIKKDAIVEIIPGIGERFALLGKVIGLGVDAVIARPPFPNLLVDLEALLSGSNIDGSDFIITNPGDGEEGLFSLDEIAQHNIAVLDDQRKWELANSLRHQAEF